MFTRPDTSDLLSSHVLCLMADDAAKASVDELFSFSVLLGGTYSGAWADASTFELAVLDQLANTSFGETPAVGRTAANFTGRVPLFNAAGRLPASSNELVHLEGDPAELIGPNTDVPPVPVLPRVASFFLLDGGDGGLRSDGTFGANASLLLVFNTTAHDPVGAIWRHEFVNENSSSTFPGGAWSLAGDGSDPFAGVHSAPEGLLFSVPLGERYTGEWLSRKWLLLRVLELTRDDTVPRPRVNQTKVHTRIGSRSTTLTTLQTNIGSSVPPRLLSATANDPDSLDCVYSSSVRDAWRPLRAPRAACQLHLRLPGSDWPIASSHPLRPTALIETRTSLRRTLLA